EQHNCFDSTDHRSCLRGPATREPTTSSCRPWLKETQFVALHACFRRLCLADNRFLDFLLQTITLLAISPEHADGQQR
ncbi:unnamed protein product, partial [Mycena citricolor]